MRDVNDFFEGKDPEKVMTAMLQFMEVFLTESGLKNNRIVEGLMAGNTAAQTMGLTRDDLEVLYAVGYAALNQGELQKAEDVFFKLVTIDPLEAKNHYCMGMVFRLKGDHEAAKKSFVNFLALDATNPDGYLRLGECFLTLGDRGMAREAFECAEAEAAKGNGDASTLAEARSKLAMLKKEIV